MGAPLREPGGGVRLQGTLRDRCRRALEKEHLSLYGSSVRGTCREAPLLGTLNDMFWKALVTAIYLHRRPVREPGGGLIYQRLLRDGRRRALETERLSLWDNC
jgi:hypothetical protein